MNSPILIVDDNSDLRKLIRLTLESQYYELHEAGNGNRALALLDSVGPRLVILDVMMPGDLDGYDVCEEIKRRHGSDIRVLMLTARGQVKDRERADLAGADHYLLKPFSPLELLQAVDEQVRAFSAEPVRKTA